MFMNNTSIKKLQFDQMDKDMEQLATIVVHQFTLIENFAHGKTEEIYQQVIENDMIINDLEMILRARLPRLVILFAPRAIELRKIITYHDVIILLKQISRLSIDIIQCIKKIHYDSPNYGEIREILKEMYSTLKKMINAVSFAFLKEDKQQAYQIIEQENHITDHYSEITNNIVASFQEVVLSGQDLQDLICLNTIGYIFEKIKRNITAIAKSTVYVIEGTDLRQD
jgi:phosphate transport system protein